MFCMRVAHGAYPSDPNGQQFADACEGLSDELPDGDNDRKSKLTALIERRPQIVAALDQVLGDQTVDKSGTFEQNELEDFLMLLLPLYGEQSDGIVPESTRALGKLATRLTDPDDPQAVEVLETIERISKRVGYRAPDRVLAMVRPTLTYDRLDELTMSLLDLVAKDGAGHEPFMKILEATALELAQKAEPKQSPSTLSLALDLVLKPDPLFVSAESQSLVALPVLARDDAGDAIPVAGGDATPFLVAGRQDDAERDDKSKLAMSDGEPAYETFDANQTALASLMRDSIPLIRRDGKDHSTVEKLLRMVRPLLGPDTMRAEAFDGKTLTYKGQDIENGPMAGFLHSIFTLLKLPETEPMLKVVERLMAEDEANATALIHAALQIDAQSDMVGFNGGKLTPGNEFWDDLIHFGLRMVTERPGLWADVLNATLDPLTVATGPILAHQMENKDLVKLAAEDINSDVTTGCPTGDASAPAYCVPVERAMPDVGMNRSIFQRTLSLIHGTYRAPNCNKEGATLTVQEPVPTTFPNPPLGPLAPIIGGLGGGSGDCPTSTVAPPPATNYKQCQLIEQKSGAVTVLRAMLGQGKVVIKDDEVTKCAAAVGTKVAEAQEKESGIKGFTLTPSTKALARFVYAKRNKFLTDMFDPLPTIDKVTVNDFEPNGMYPLEVIDPAALVDGKPQSFLTAALPLLGAFDKHDQVDANGDPVGSYMFAELLELLHMHYSSPKTALCPEGKVEVGNEGCTQSIDADKPFYSHGSNLVSYEPLIIWALTNQDLLGVLSRSTAALQKIVIDDKNGVQILDAFLQAVLKPNPNLKYLDGRTYAKTNACSKVDDSDPAAPRCLCPDGSDDGADGKTCRAADGSSVSRGRIIEGGVPPLYLMLDALNDLDLMWEKNPDQHELYLEVRSTLVDQLLQTVKPADTTALKNRRAYALTRRGLPWILQRLADHSADREEWANGLIDRLAGVIGHPLAAHGMDLFDKFWDDKAAGDEVALLIEYLLDEDKNPEAFTGAIIGLADTLTFLDKDPDLTPAIRFAALALAENALDVVDGKSDETEIEKGTAYRFLEVTHEIGKRDDSAELSTLAKMLRNSVLPMANSELPEHDGKSPLEVFIDAVADVNRVDPSEDTTKTLNAADNKLVFEGLNDFLSNKDVGLERLYLVIENREIK